MSDDPTMATLTQVVGTPEAVQEQTAASLTRLAGALDRLEAGQERMLKDLLEGQVMMIQGINGWMEKLSNEMGVIRDDVFVSHNSNARTQQEVHNANELYVRLAAEWVTFVRKLHSQDERLRAVEDKLRQPPT